MNEFQMSQHEVVPPNGGTSDSVISALGEALADRAPVPEPSATINEDMAPISPIAPAGKRFTTMKQVFKWYLSTSYVKTSRASVVAMTERKRVWDKFLKEFGGRRVKDCTAADLLAFLDARTSLGAWSKRRWAATIRRPLNVAARLGLITRNPFIGLQLPSGKRGRDLTAEEFQSLLRCALPCYRRLLIFLRLSGARPGELRALTWDQIHPETCCILQHEHKTAYTCKTPRPRRIALTATLVKLLLWIRRNKPHPVHVFVNEIGRPFINQTITKYVRSLRARIGLPEDVKLYGCRHAFATNAIINGVDLASLAELMGHRSTDTTTHYLHLASKFDHLTAAAQKAGRLSNAPPQVPNVPVAGAKALADEIAKPVPEPEEPRQKVYRAKRQDQEPRPKLVLKFKAPKQNPNKKAKLQKLLAALVEEL